MPAAPTRDPRLPYREIDDGFLAPRDPVLGYVKIGGKDATIRYGRGTGKPWVAPSRFIDPARFEVTTREKKTKTVKGAKGSGVAGKDFAVDLGYVRDETFHELEGVGPTPSSLRVRLLYPRWNQNLVAFLGAYGREWVCRGNGVEAIDIKRGECACPCPRLIQFSGEYKGTPPNDGTELLPCKPHAQLNVMLYDAGIFGGFWPFKTTSYETISNLIKSLRMFEEIFGRVDGLPLELRVMAATKQIPGGGTTVQPIVTLVLAASMDAARQIAKDAAAESRKFLPAGRALDHETYLEAVVSEMESEAEAYAGEFLPKGEGAEEEEEDEVPPAIERGPFPHMDGGGPRTEENPHGEEDAPPPMGEVEEPAREGDPDPDAGDERPSNDPQLKVGDSDRNNPEQLARDVLQAAGWEPDAVRDRVAHHAKEGNVQELLDRLAKHMPEAWATVIEAEVEDEAADGDEPEDGLPF